MEKIIKDRECDRLYLNITKVLDLLTMETPSCKITIVIKTIYFQRTSV